MGSKASDLASLQGAAGPVMPSDDEHELESPSARSKRSRASLAGNAPKKSIPFGDASVHSDSDDMFSDEEGAPVATSHAAKSTCAARGVIPPPKTRAPAPTPRAQTELQARALEHGGDDDDDDDDDDDEDSDNEEDNNAASKSDSDLSSQMALQCGRPKSAAQGKETPMSLEAEHERARTEGTVGEDCEAISHDALDSSFASTYTLLVRDKASYYVVGSHAILHAQMKDGDGNPCEPLQMREDVFLCSNRDRNAVCKSYVAEKGYSEVAQTVIVMSLHGKSDEKGTRLAAYIPVKLTRAESETADRGRDFLRRVYNEPNVVLLWPLVTKVVETLFKRCALLPRKLMPARAWNNYIVPNASVESENEATSGGNEEGSCRFVFYGAPPPAERKRSFESGSCSGGGGRAPARLRLANNNHASISNSLFRTGFTAAAAKATAAHSTALVPVSQPAAKTTSTSSDSTSATASAGNEHDATIESAQEIESQDLTREETRLAVPSSTSVSLVRPPSSAVVGASPIPAPAFSLGLDSFFYHRERRARAEDEDWGEHVCIKVPRGADGFRSLTVDLTWH